MESAHNVTVTLSNAGCLVLRKDKTDVDEPIRCNSQTPEVNNTYQEDERNDGFVMKQPLVCFKELYQNVSVRTKETHENICEDT